MVTWKLLTDEVAMEIWDEALLRFDDDTPFQSSPDFVGTHLQAAVGKL